MFHTKWLAECVHRICFLLEYQCIMLWRATRWPLVTINLKHSSSPCALLKRILRLCVCVNSRLFGLVWCIVLAWSSKRMATCVAYRCRPLCVVGKQSVWSDVDLWWWRDFALAPFRYYYVIKDVMLRLLHVLCEKCARVARNVNSSQ